MRKTLSLGVAAMTAAVGMLSAGGADARDHGRYYDRHSYHRYYDRGDHGDAVAAGIVGLALGAALASNDGGGRRYYDDGRRYYSGRGYYYSGPRYGYYDRPYYRSCRTVRAWDPYYGRVYERRCW